MRRAKYDQAILSNEISKSEWRDNLQIYHILPRSLGKDFPDADQLLNHRDNLRIIHIACHKSKTALDKHRRLAALVQAPLSILNRSKALLRAASLQRERLEGNHNECRAKGACASRKRRKSFKRRL